MKKFLLILIALLCISPLVGCNEEEEPEAPAEGTVLPEGYKFLVIEDETTGDYYEGFVNEENKPHGFGKMMYANGDMYEGYFENGLKQGTGTMTFQTACIYIGEWNEDQMEGSGYMKWPMGDYFYGEWKDGNPYYGTKYFLQAGAPIDAPTEGRYCIYTGTFDGGGLLSGWGTMRWPSGDVYVGQWQNNVRHGWGTQYWPSEDPNIPEYSFVGQFNELNGGWIQGEGTMYYRDGSVVKGTWNGTELISAE